jgi:hypothetical protein
MSRLLLTIAAALTFAGTTSAKTWDMYTSTDGATGRATIFRYISKFDVGFKRSAQPVRAIIVWTYKGTNGMPALSERQRMDAMEDLLGPVLELDEFSSLALVSTGEDLREWIYYTKSEEGFLTRLNQALGGHPAFPIEIHIADDPNWSSYQEFIDGLRK